MWTKGSCAELQGLWFKCYQTLAHHSLLYWLDHPDQRMRERARDECKKKSLGNVSFKTVKNTHVHPHMSAVCCTHSHAIFQLDTNN